jgi:Zn finger protein HypA/HybF involved in hydrogenase expression
MEKLGVDEGVDQEVLEKQAAAGCPKCGSKVEKVGNLLYCPNCGTEPWEGEKK